jgi:hypothetical protein
MTMDISGRALFHGGWSTTHMDRNILGQAGLSLGQARAKGSQLARLPHRLVTAVSSRSRVS